MNWMGIDWTPILIAAAINVVLGLAWYSNYLFGKRWLKLVGKKKSPKTDVTEIIISFVAAIAMAVVIQGVMSSTAGGLALNGALIASLLWLGVMIPVFVAQYLKEDRSLNLIVIDGGYWLVSFAIMGALLASWH
jgi:hypothetical protein